MKKAITLKRYQRQSKIIFILTVISIVLLIVLLLTMMLDSAENRRINMFERDMFELKSEIQLYMQTGNEKLDWISASEIDETIYALKSSIGGEKFYDDEMESRFVELRQYWNALEFEIDTGDIEPEGYVIRYELLTTQIESIISRINSQQSTDFVYRVLIICIVIVIDAIMILFNWKNIKGTLIGMALRDPLTGCFNRNYFDEFYGEQLRLYNRYKHVFSVALIDIDDFKKINDTYGHDIGDLVLKEMVQIVRMNIRSSDVLVRFGGEEFLILFPDSDIVVVKEIVEKIRAIIEEKKDFSSGSLTISVGIATINQATDENSSVLKLADLALYYAKGNGKNQVKCYKRNMNDSLRTK